MLEDWYNLTLLWSYLPRTRVSLKGKICKMEDAGECSEDVCDNAKFINCGDGRSNQKAELNKLTLKG